MTCDGGVKMVESMDNWTHTENSLVPHHLSDLPVSTVLHHRYDWSGDCIVQSV